MFEQEIIRCFNQFYREEINQSIPFSFCSIINDEETYSTFQNENSCNQSQNSSFPLMNSNNNQPEEITSLNSNNQKTEQDKFSNNINDLSRKFQKLKVK